MKRIIFVLLFLLLGMKGFSSISLAQTAIPFPPSNSQVVNSDFNASNSAGTNTGVAPSFNNPQNFSSAQVRLGSIIRTLVKHGFRADEKVGILVSNPGRANYYARVTDSEGQELEVQTFTQDQGTDKEVVVLPPVHFKPGKYTLTVTSSDGQTFTQDFTWGVLAINTNKSIYAPGETAKIAIAVLDDKGQMVCSAKSDLVITDPSGNTTTLSTDNGGIKINDVCSKHEFTLTPDYESSYTTLALGTYQMSLSAQTPNGQRSITDSFEVRSSVPFDVERSTATRIYPPIPYPVDLNIVANQDFTGTVSEVVPSNFAINQNSSSDKPFTTEEASQTSLNTLLSSDSAKLGLPYQGFYPIEQEFGEQLLKDPAERDLYARFNLAGHDGVDFGLPDGTPVLAADDGAVSLSGPGAYGTTIVLDHIWGRSYYGHLSFTKVRVGQKVHKGDEIALSGHTGLATGPHLHFGMKPWNADTNNGYYGKIDPLPFLGIPSYQDNALKVLSWKIDVKKGDKINLGYFYKSPNVSPQFYKIGPLRFTDSSGKNVFEELRQWQIAVDADGSGTNAVWPTTGVTNAGQQVYDFTYKNGESVATASGSFTIDVPSTWTQPQTTTPGSAGYVRVDSSSTGTVATQIDGMDSTIGTGWQANNSCSGTGGLATDSTNGNFFEGSGSLKCVEGNEANNDSWFNNLSLAPQDWSSYTSLGMWVKTSVQITSSGLRFIYDDTASCVSLLETISTSSPATINANVWTWVTWTFGATTRTTIRCYGFSGTATSLDSRNVWTDDLLMGPGTPTVTGSGPWTINTLIFSLPATTGNITLNYGGRGGAEGVTNPSTAGVTTFTTKSKISAGLSNNLANISVQPTVTLGDMIDMMRHGKFFNGGTRQAFAF